MKRILSIIFATCLFIGLFACVKAVIDKPDDDVTIEDSSSGGAEECEHEWVTDAAVAATCTEAGKTEGEHCSKCGTVKTAQEEIPAHGHTEEEIPAVAITCTTDGYTAGKRCTVCETVTVEPQRLETPGHMEHLLDGVEATCTTSGLTEGKKCSRCDVILVEQEVIPALGHTEVVESLAVAATCTEAGHTESRKCFRCNAVVSTSQVVPALGHVEVKDAAVEATCTTAGKTEGKHCSRCSTVLTAQTTVAALGHVEVVDPAVAATCTTAGKTEGKHCSRCSTVLTAQTTVAALGHVEVKDAAVAATCTTAGKTEGKHCSRCSTVLTAQTTVAALGHVEVKDSAVEATCTTAGKTEGKHCSRCSTVLTAQTTVAALGHVEVKDSAVEATCTTAGKTEGKHCSRCSTVLTAQTTVAALGHVEVVDPAVAATRTSEGKTEGKHCSRCNEVLVAQQTLLKQEVLSGKWELKTLDVEFGNVLSFSATLSFSCNNTIYTDKQLRLWHLDDGSSYVQIGLSTSFAVGDVFDFGSTEQEVSGEFYAMFDKFFDPVVEYKLSGVWKFNDDFKSTDLPGSTTEATDSYVEVNFTSNGTSYVKFEYADQIWYYKADGTYDDCFFRMWSDEAYATVDFGSTEQTVTERFYNWFTSNASQNIVQTLCSLTINTLAGESLSLRYQIGEGEWIHLADTSPVTLVLEVPVNCTFTIKADYRFCDDDPKPVVTGGVRVLSSDSETAVFYVTGAGTITVNGPSD